MRTPRGFFARGFLAWITNSGTITVRAQYETLILSRGGAAHANVFARTLLALYGEVPWTAVPVMPVEVMLGVGRIADHLEGEVGLDAAAHVEAALVDEGPAAVPTSSPAPCSPSTARCRGPRCR
jgi:hypothetical protein